MLPTTKTPPRTLLSDLTVLAWGQQKIGKSSFCSHAEDALFLATEAGLNSLNVYQTPISNWDEFLQACAEIAEGKHPFKTIVVDTVDNAYRFCAQYICTKHKIEHESDLGYGKGWALINSEFYRVLNKLALLPYGLFMISHAQEKEIESRTGKYTKMMPTLPEKARKIVLGMVDMILYCDLDVVKNTDGTFTQRRVIRTKPSLYYEAGDRTGRLPEVFDLDYSKYVEAFGEKKTASQTVSTPAKPDAAKSKSEKKEA
ncbi:MAG: hypothetical protein BWY28_01769 [bacterium ADurb.Bin236]|nr:MAG: hypothetical protein BWY28_01769 [bacterium ADurb.Bin236]HOY63479.1 ATP-binding protein [bacterium]